LCIKLLHPSEFLKDKYIDKVKNNNLVKNLIHHSLEKNLNEKMLICHYCNTINEFIFNKKLSNNYIFIFDKKFDYQHPLFLKIMKENILFMKIMKLKIILFYLKWMNKK